MTLAVTTLPHDGQSEGEATPLNRDHWHCRADPDAPMLEV